MAKEKDRVYMLAAMNSKPVAANSSSVTFSQVASLFHTTFNQFDCLRLHEELLELVQSAEADLAMEGTNTIYLYSLDAKRCNHDGH